MKRESCTSQDPVWLRGRVFCFQQWRWGRASFYVHSFNFFITIKCPNLSHTSWSIHSTKENCIYTAYSILHQTQKKKKKNYLKARLKSISLSNLSSISNKSSISYQSSSLIWNRYFTLYAVYIIKDDACKLIVANSCHFQRLGQV